jgi:hypothetical protein
MGDIVNSVADVFGFGPASKAADAQLGAAQMGSAAQIQAAQLAADAARFRPVGMTTRFGSSNFGFDGSGNLSSAGYTLSPELKALQDYVMAQTGASVNDTQGLLGLGRSYLAQSPEQAAANYIAQQRTLLAPSEQSQLSGIRSNLQRTGRGGLAVGQGGDLGAANPELQAYYNSLAQRDLQLGAAADQEARNRITFGQGLLSSAYAPIQTGLGIASSIEALGQTPLSLGAELGGRSATAGQTQANALLQGGLASARTLQGSAALPGMARAQGLQGLLDSPSLSYRNLQNTKAGQWFSNLIGGGSSGPTPADFGYNPYQPTFGGFDAGSSSTPGLWQTESYD